MRIRRQSGTQQGPVCSSCHDLHGGLAGTPLLRGPQPAAPLWGAYDDGNWCFACNSLALVLPPAHHSTSANLSTPPDAMTSQLGCGDCHGPAGTTDWRAHNGFWAWPVAYTAVDDALCTACHSRLDPADLLSPALKGQSFVEPASFPATHGTVRGSGSHYLGADSNEFPGVDVRLTVGVAGVALALRAWRYQGPVRTVPWPNRTGLLRVLTTLATLAVFLFLVEPLGMTLGSGLLVSFLVWYLGGYRLIYAGLLGLATGGIVYGVFIRLLQLSFPIGPLGR